MGFKAVRTSAIQLQYNYNTRKIFLLYCSCIVLVRTAERGAAKQPAPLRSNALSVMREILMCLMH